jgi:hypothetical protein
MTGVTKADLKSWEQDDIFTQILATIDIIFTEGLASLDYLEAVTNGKIRGRVLQARKAKGYEPKAQVQKNTLNVIGEGGLSGIMKLIGN